MRTLANTDNLVALTLGRTQREFLLAAIDAHLIDLSEAAENGNKKRVQEWLIGLRIANALNLALGGNQKAWWQKLSRRNGK